MPGRTLLRFVTVSEPTHPRVTSGVRLAPRHELRARRHYSLAEKLAIVRESMQPGVTQISVSRRHGLSKNLLSGWRKSLASMLRTEPEKNCHGTDQEVRILQERIAELERMLGRNTFEIEMLRNRLQEYA